ncbi:lysylphosphatidylglycerol synthase domain-containing protein [Curtobacterium sp. ME-Dv--P-122a]|uniref:lysylphosphatidylglycerol synthase domain-containing protein n=1 Tax=Curtobacterium sp. ME-Dv--P-122a TaxID=3040286 RepID=UPI0025518EC2|nr:lysylphosphatidylglycerol synthase domain-containing protein [Curtobacterium sp. ME-Dv--P-122a]
MSASTSDTPAPEGKRPSKRRRFLGKAIPIAFYVLLAVFLVLYVRSVDWGQLAGLDWQWSWVILATVISLGFRYWGVGIWFYLLRRLGATGLKGSGVTLTYVYAKSWMGRYIPGAATWIIGKVYFASKHGVSKARLGVSGLLEGALQIAATLALALVLLLIDPRTHNLDPWLIVLMIAAFVGCVVCLIPRVFVFLIGIALKILRRKPLEADVRPNLGTVLGGAGLYVAGAVLSGTAYYFITLGVYPSLKITDAAFVIGAASMASAISMLAVFAPGGLGVREGVQALLLALVMPAPIALVVVVVTRVWSLAVDGLFLLCAAAPTWFRRNRPTDDPSAVEGGVPAA